MKYKTKEKFIDAMYLQLSFEGSTDIVIDMEDEGRNGDFFIKINDVVVGFGCLRTMNYFIYTYRFQQLCVELSDVSSTGIGNAVRPLLAKKFGFHPDTINRI